MRRLLVTAAGAAVFLGATAPAASADAGCPGDRLGPAGGVGTIVHNSQEAGLVGRDFGTALGDFGGFGALIQNACNRP